MPRAVVAPDTSSLIRRRVVLLQALSPCVFATERGYAGIPVAVRISYNLSPELSGVWVLVSHCKLCKNGANPLCFVLCGLNLILRDSKFYTWFEWKKLGA